MPMDIPTIQVTPPDFSGVEIYPFGGNGESITSNNTTPVSVQIPARVAPIVTNPSKAATQLDAYGPGSVEYTILNVALNDGNTETPVEIDPKTWISNYGILHVGPSNITSPSDTVPKVITFTATYKYINPSTGVVYSLNLGNFKIVATHAAVNVIQETLTAIKYDSQPGTNG